MHSELTQGISSLLKSKALASKVDSLPKEPSNSWQKEYFFTTKHFLNYPNAIKAFNMLHGIEFQQPLTSNSLFILIIRSSMVRDSYVHTLYMLVRLCHTAVNSYNTHRELLPRPK